MNPSDEDDLNTLEADLRRALQHRHAEYERVKETQRQVEALMERARALLAEKSDAAVAAPAEESAAAEDSKA